jgi:eukaryotic-like serine/threonine-protein kinase
MYQQNALRDRRPAVGLTQEYVSNDGPPSKPRPRCRMTQGSGLGSDLTGEQVGLLSSRLRIASLILATAMIVFFVRNLFEPQELSPDWSLSLGLCGGMMVLTSVLAGLLWARRDLCGPYLRLIEIALFGGMALFFTVMQLNSLRNGYILQFAAKGSEGFFLRMVAIAFSVRWFSIIVLYGAFIPNTWRRCAMVVGAIAGIPIVINMGAGLWENALRPYAGELIFDTAIIMAVASAIAIFGSYKISTLHQEAVEAKKLGQYSLKKKLGAGGMGEVYLAEHMMLRRPCAVKLIRADQAGDPANLVRFEREVRSTATLTHPNTVEIFDYGNTEDGTFYYVMEYLPGLSLQEIVEQSGPLPPERAVYVLRQVCGALREAHGFGIIHRDIKPSNILVCERGGVQDVAKLLDFGLAQCTGIHKQNADKLTIQGTIVGSPPFMSPEQASGKDDLDARTDIYSLGAVAYFLLTGKAPYERDTAMKMMMAHAYEPLLHPNKLRPDLPHDLQAVIVRCLEKDPANRLQTAGSLDKALAECGCAGSWTVDRALTWWRNHDSGPVKLVDEQQTVAAAALAT